MYVSFFGLKQPPFSIAPDPHYLYMSERHREALAHLLYGVQGGGGFVLLTGEIGAGKTTVCRCFLEQVPPSCQVAYIFNPQLSVPELLQTVCDEFGIDVPAGLVPASRKAYIDALNAHLLAAHAEGRQCLLIIDEAQRLSAPVLEQLRLLTNLETHERKLLQIVLIGQPELRTLLAGANLEQLAQRVIARYHLGALSQGETAAYVAHRLSVAGLSGAMPFDAGALRRVHALSAGVPRRINLLCDRALLGAFAEGRARVGRRIVDRAAKEVFDGRRGRPGGRRRALLGTLLGAALLLAAGAGALLRGGLPARPGAPVQPPAASHPAQAAVAASRPTPATSAAGVAGAASVAGAALATGAASASGGADEPPPLLPEPGLAVFPADKARAWVGLARQWGWSVPAASAADPCGAAATQGLRCYRSAAGTLGLLRQLDQPVLLWLRGDDGSFRFARLQALGARQAVLAADERAYTLPLDQLATLWRGEYATFWRPPEGYTRLLEPGARGPAVDALARGLADWQQAPAPPPGQVLSGELAARLTGFQFARGLEPDGIAGPTTFMSLDRVQGVAGPNLASDPTER